MVVQHALSGFIEGRKEVAVGGTIAKRYRIGDRLGEGGMAVVHKGWHTLFDQPIAIKLLKPEYWQNEEAVTRFLQEARALARLRGVHVPNVLDIGRIESGAPFMVTELLEGDDLGRLLATHGPLSIERAVQLVVAACDAIADAHEKGIVHRDLKPDNLFLVGASEAAPLIKVLDFGVAKRLDAGDVTNTKQSLGSPHYMAPEQIVTPAEVDVRADIWSLGIVFFELLTGRVPFDGPNVRSVCIATVRAECPAPSSLRPEVPAELDAVVLKCLKKRPDQRFASAKALKAALESFLEHAGVSQECIDAFEALEDRDVTALDEAELNVPMTVCIEVEDAEAPSPISPEVVETPVVEASEQENAVGRDLGAVTGPADFERPRASRMRGSLLLAAAAALVATIFSAWPPAREAAQHAALAHVATIVAMRSAKDNMTAEMRRWTRLSLTTLPNAGEEPPEVGVVLESPTQPSANEQTRAESTALPAMRRDVVVPTPSAAVARSEKVKPALWKPRYALHPGGPWQPRPSKHGERIGNSDLINPYPDR